MAKGIRTTDGKEITYNQYLKMQNSDSPALGLLLKSMVYDKERPQEPNRYSVGDIISCLRTTYYDKTIGHYETIEQIVKSALGRAAHYSFLRHFDLKEREVELTFNHNNESLTVVGKFDGYSFDDKALVDIKTIDDICKNELPRQKDVIQIQCFYTIAASDLPIPIEKLLIIYIDKKGQIRTCDVPVVDRTVFIKERTIVLHEALKCKKPPPEEPTYFCKYCSHNPKCSLPEMLRPKLVTSMGGKIHAR